MRYRPSRLRKFPRSVAAIIALTPCTLLAMAVARGDDLLGVYFGGGYGQAHLRAEPGPIIPQSTGSLSGFDMTHSAFKAIAGIRPLPFVGAEISYMDFGRVSGITGEAVPGVPGAVVSSEQVSQKGESALGLLYLPVPIVDVYLKGGLSRIATEFGITGTGEGAGAFRADHDTTDTAFAYGAGLQWKLGQWAVRGEYERFSAAGANPSLLSLSMTFWLQ
jgi:opacity protein-like surface antigen